VPAGDGEGSTVRSVGKFFEKLIIKPGKQYGKPEQLIGGRGSMRPPEILTSYGN
jgi:hypothetical protein